MTGSFHHCDQDEGFDFSLIENMEDARNACEHMYWMIHHLTHGDEKTIKVVSGAAYALMADNLMNGEIP